MGNFISRFLTDALVAKYTAQNSPSGLELAARLSPELYLEELGSLQVRAHRQAGHTTALWSVSLTPALINRYGVPLLLSPTRETAKAANDLCGRPHNPFTAFFTTFQEYLGCNSTHGQFSGIYPRLICCDGRPAEEHLHKWVLEACGYHMHNGTPFAFVEVSK
jgi:hypothetical protein